MLQYVNPHHPAGVLYPQGGGLGLGSGGWAPMRSLNGSRTSSTRVLPNLTADEADPTFTQFIKGQRQAVADAVMSFLRGGR